MKKVGSYMAIFGLLAIVLNFVDRVPTLLMWIYNWGDTTAWVIKIGLVVVGAVLYFMGGASASSEEEAKEEITE
ncbi:hypothetical protein [Polaribacter aquimarinus]|uniref:DUF378 domain-containing protein n=1 Tax=Polaribacter aquimarinus TaxID=2100726 RepID=A0A2U2JDR7_9FLAO|nr:hypothetical protein [Polaribacter aquimarinus]PWG06455.1 hypothetical protein DIS07_01085 [Polaribacter aquimarinus]